MYLLAMLLTVVMWLQPAETQSKRKADPNSSDAIERYLWLVETYPAKLKDVYWRVEFHPTTLTIEEDEENPLTPDEVRKEFVNARGWFNELIDATKLNASSITVPDAPLGTLRDPVKPEILTSPLRRLCDVLLANATFLWAEREEHAAVESLNAVLRLSKHIGGGAGPFQIHAMAERLMFGNAVRRGIEMLESDANSTRLTADDRDTWCGVLASYGDPHPFALREVFIRQVEEDIRWAEGRIKNDSVDDELLLVIAQFAAVVSSEELTERIREVNPDVHILPANREAVLRVIRAEPRCKPEALRKAQSDAKRILQNVSRAWDTATTRKEVDDALAELDESGYLWPVYLQFASSYWREENETTNLIAKLRTLCGCTTPEHAP